MNARRTCLPTLALSAMLLPACGGAPPPRRDTPRTARAASTEPAVAEPLAEDGDVRIARSVRAELAVDPAVDPDAVEVDVTDGVVELRGEVPHLLMADAAIARAEMVHGVRAVIDLMELPRAPRADAVIRSDVEEALEAGAPEGARPLTVRVIDGVVTLRGEAASFAEKQLAERAARSVRGARDVVNQIEVRNAGPRADAEILDDVQRALRADRWVDEWLLTAEVDGGIVSLRGVQPTAAAKRRAIEDAWVSGVRSVDGTLVEVQPELSAEQRRPPPGYVYPDDTEILESIRLALARDPRLAESRVRPTVERGIVTLEGTVRSMAARTAAEEAAPGVAGVWRVDDRLSVGGAGRADAELQRSVDRALARAAAIDEDAVSARVERGVVILVGAVETPYARNVAEEVVSRIPGVRGIDDRIEAPPQRETPPTDEEIAQNVRAHLEAHPYVDARSVQVEVANGEVILHGQLDDWRAEREAVRAAYEAGATSVVEDIELREPASVGAP